MNNRICAGMLSVGQATKLSQVDLKRKYDLVLGGLSWERRTTSAFCATKQLDAEIKLLKFSSRDADTDKRKNENLELLKKTFKCDVVDLSRSVAFSENVEKIERFIEDQYVATSRPLSVLLDITCVPKSYILFLLGLGFSKDFFTRLDCLYAEGAYSLDSLQQDDPAFGSTGRAIMSDGAWESVQIPYLESAATIPADRDLLVAMGGEVGLSLPFIEKYEPSRLGLVLISESLVQTPDQLPDSERQALAELLAEPNVTRFDVPLCDVAGLADRAIQFCKNSKAESVSGVAIGSKTHALALGIAALSEDNMEVICRVPRAYKPLDVAATGQISFYEIEDRFDPSAYL